MVLSTLVRFVFARLAAVLTAAWITVKKVRLRMHTDTKIFREVNALSRLSHRFIVRYYTTWVETSDPTSTAPSDAGDSETESEFSGDMDDAKTSVPSSRSHSSRHSTSSSFNLYDDLDDTNMNVSGGSQSFPSIHFGMEEEEDTDSDGEPIDKVFDGPPPIHTPEVQRTLYIQMVGVFE